MVTARHMLHDQIYWRVYVRVRHIFMQDLNRVVSEVTPLMRRQQSGFSIRNGIHATLGAGRVLEGRGGFGDG